MEIAPLGARRTIAVLALIALVLALGLATAVLLPLGSGPDETDHFDYAHFLGYERRLPDPRTEDVGQIQHPPLPYAAFAAAHVAFQKLDASLPADAFKGRDWSRWFGRKTTFEPGLENWKEVAPELTSRPALPATRLGDKLSSRRWTVYALRGLPLLLGAGTILFLLGALRRIWPDRPNLAVLALATIVTTFQFPTHFATISNDPFVTFLAAWAGYLVLDGRARGALARPKTSIALGLVLGLGFLVKLQFLGTAVFVLLVVLRSVPGGPERRRALWPLALGPIVLAAWWHLRQIALQGSLLALKDHADHRPQLFRLEGFHPLLVLDFLEESATSFFGLLGQDGIRPHGLYYVVAAGLAALALFGAVFLGRKDEVAPIETTPPAWPRPPVTESLLAVLLLVVSLNVSNAIYYHHHGRYLLAAIVPLTVLFAVGLDRALGKALKPTLVGALLWNLAFTGTAVFVIERNAYSIDLEKVDRGQVVAYYDGGSLRFDQPGLGGFPSVRRYSILNLPEKTSRYAVQMLEKPEIVYRFASPTPERRKQIRARYPSPLGAAGLGEVPAPTANCLLADSWLVHGPISLWNGAGERRWPVPAAVDGDGKLEVWWENHHPGGNHVGVAEIWYEDAWVGLEGAPTLKRDGDKVVVSVRLQNIDPNSGHTVNLMVTHGPEIYAKAEAVAVPAASRLVSEIRFARTGDLDIPNLRIELIDTGWGPWCDQKIALWRLPDVPVKGRHEVPDLQTLRIGDQASTGREIARLKLPRLLPGAYRLGITHTREADPIADGLLAIVVDGATVDLSSPRRGALTGDSSALDVTWVGFEKTTPGETTLWASLRTTGKSAPIAVDIDRLVIEPDLWNRSRAFSYGFEPPR